MVPLFGQIRQVLQPLELKLLIRQVLIHLSHVDDEPEFSLRALRDEPQGAYPFRPLFFGEYQNGSGCEHFLDRGGHETLLGQCRR